MFCTWEQAAEFQNELTAASDWNLHVTEEYRQKEKFAYRYTSSKNASVGKNYRLWKSVCIVCQKEKQGTVKPWNSNILQVQTMQPSIFVHWLLFWSTTEKGIYRFRFEGGYVNHTFRILQYSVKILTQCTSRFLSHITHLEEKWHNSIFMGCYWPYVQTNYWKIKGTVCLFYLHKYLQFLILKFWILKLKKNQLLLLINCTFWVGSLLFRMSDIQFLKVVNLICHIHLIFKGLF
jgi:hypothetical protein